MSQVILYQSEDGRTKLDVRLEGQTVWLSQKQLTELFGKAKGTISEHIKHIFEDGELESEATVRLFRTVQIEGEREVTREVECYNLDMVLALGFRVRSPMAVRFRQWAADKLMEYIVKGFVLDDVRLKEPGGWDYFDELLARIRALLRRAAGRAEPVYEHQGVSINPATREVSVDAQPVVPAKPVALWSFDPGRGSTLTMQVARLLEDGGTGEVVGKLRQIRVALALERRLTKDSTTRVSSTKPLASSCFRARSTSSGLASAAVSLSLSSLREYSRCASKLTALALTVGGLRAAGVLPRPAGGASALDAATPPGTTLNGQFSTTALT